MLRIALTPGSDVQMAYMTLVDWLVCPPHSEKAVIPDPGLPVSGVTEYSTTESDSTNVHTDKSGENVYLQNRKTDKVQQKTLGTKNQDKTRQTKNACKNN